MMAIFNTALTDGVVLTVPTAVLAQVHRGNSPLIARMLQACDLEELTPSLARRVGKLLGDSGTKDLVDGAVVESAAPRGDRIVTSDADDIDRLLRTHAANHSLRRGPCLESVPPFVVPSWSARSSSRLPFP